MKFLLDDRETVIASKVTLGISATLLILTGLFLQYGFNDKGGYDSNLFYGPLRLGVIGILIDVILAVLVVSAKPLVVLATAASVLCVVNSIRRVFIAFGYAALGCLINVPLLVFWIRYGDALIGVPGVPNHSPLVR